MSAGDNDPFAALDRLWEVAQHDHGGAIVVLRVLLGLYNGDRFKFDLNELRRLDNGLLQDVMSVIEMDARPAAEVHVLLGDVGPQFEELAYRRGIKGHASKKQVEESLAYQRRRQDSRALAATGQQA